MEKLHIDLINKKYRPIVFDLLLKLKRHSKESYEHSLDVAVKAVLIARSLEVEGDDLETLYTASLLHDIGKLYIDKSLLHKKNATEAEKEFIQMGHIEGTKVILEKYFDDNIVRLATHHHERLNSSGYPERLNAKQLDLLDRILQVADVTSALSMKRSYQDARPPKQVMEVLEELIKRHELDRKCVRKIEKICLIPHKEESQPGSN